MAQMFFVLKNGLGVKFAESMEHVEASRHFMCD